MKNLIITLTVFFLAATASALQVTPIKILDPADQNLSSTGFTSSEKYIYQSVPQDSFSRINIVNIYSAASGALVVSLTVSRDFRLNEILVLEKLGKFVLSADDTQRPGELGSIDVIDLKTGAQGPNVFSIGSDYVAVNESRQELYVRNPLFGNFNTFDLVTGKSHQIKYHPNEESIIFAGETLLKIAYEDKSKGTYSLSKLSDGKKLGTFESQNALFIQNPTYALTANRFLWIFKRSGKALLEELVDLQTGGVILAGNTYTMLSGYAEAAQTIGILDTINLTLSKFDVANGIISQLGQLDLGHMNFATGFFLLSSNKARVSTYQKEVTDLTLSPPSNDTSGKLTCDGTVSLSQQGNFALCSGKQSSWWKIQ